MFCSFLKKKKGSDVLRPLAVVLDLAPFFYEARPWNFGSPQTSM